MNKILNLRIYTPSQLFLEEVIKKVSVYGKEGFYTILPNHIDYISSFDDGIIIFEKQDSSKIFIGVNQGVLIKTGREIQISTFSAVYGGTSLDELKNVLKTLIEKEEELMNLDKKLKVSLRNIEINLFNNNFVNNNE